MIGYEGSRRSHGVTDRGNGREDVAKKARTKKFRLLSNKEMRTAMITFIETMYSTCFIFYVKYVDIMEGRKAVARDDLRGKVNLSQVEFPCDIWRDRKAGCPKEDLFALKYFA